MVAVTLAATAAIMAAVVKVTEVLVVMAELWRWSARGARARSATIRGRISCGCAAVLWFRPEPSGCRIWHVSGRWKCRASPHVKDVPSDYLTDARKGQSAARRRNHHFTRSPNRVHAAGSSIGLPSRCTKPAARDDAAATRGAARAAARAAEHGEYLLEFVLVVVQQRVVLRWRPGQRV